MASRMLTGTSSAVGRHEPLEALDTKEEEPFETLKAPADQASLAARAYFGRARVQLRPETASFYLKA